MWSTSIWDEERSRRSSADEDQEQDPDRWCSHTACGQEVWQILSQWVWNLRLELGHTLHPTAMRMTEFAPADLSAESASRQPLTPTTSYGLPTFASTWKLGRMSGQDFVLQPDGTLRCLADHPLYPQERRPERDGTLRVVYAARIGDCRPCPLRQQCQWHGTSTKKPRRVSAVLHPIITAPILHEATKAQPAVHPHPLGRLATSLPSAGGGQAPSLPAGRLSDTLIRPHRLSLHHLDLFPVHSGHIGDFRGPNVWLAMPLRRQRLPSRSPSLASRTPLPLLWACRRSNTAYKNVAEFVLSSIGISVGAARHAAFPSPSRSFSLLCPALASLVPNSAASPWGRNLFVSGTPTISPLHAVSQGCSIGFPHLVAQLF